jgi:hypothetical protein
MRVLRHMSRLATLPETLDCGSAMAAWSARYR